MFILINMFLSTLFNNIISFIYLLIISMSAKLIHILICVSLHLTSHVFQLGNLICKFSIIAIIFLKFSLYLVVTSFLANRVASSLPSALQRKMEEFLPASLMLFASSAAVGLGVSTLMSKFNLPYIWANKVCTSLFLIEQ